MAACQQSSAVCLTPRSGLPTLDPSAPIQSGCDDVFVAGGRRLYDRRGGGEQLTALA